MKPVITLKYTSPPLKYQVKFVEAVLDGKEIARYKGRESYPMLAEMLVVALKVKGYNIQDYNIVNEIRKK